VLFVHFVFAFVSSAVGPCVSSLTMHIIVFPLTCIASSVFPFVFTETLDSVFIPVSVVP
jgi:hypothetical protein